LDQLKDALGVLRVLLVPPLDACNPASDWSKAYSRFPTVAAELTYVHNTINTLVGDPGSGADGAGDKIAQDATKLAAIQADIDIFTSAMTAAQKASDDKIADLKTSNANLQKKIDEEKKKRHPDAQLIKALNDQIASQQNMIHDEMERAKEA